MITRFSVIACLLLAAGCEQNLVVLERDADDAPSCAFGSCEELDYECGDVCDRWLRCGVCPEGQVCGDPVPGRCGALPAPNGFPSGQAVRIGRYAGGPPAGFASDGTHLYVWPAFPGGSSPGRARAVRVPKAGGEALVYPDGGSADTQAGSATLLVYEGFVYYANPTQPRYLRTDVQGLQGRDATVLIEGIERPCNGAIDEGRGRLVIGQCPVRDGAGRFIRVPLEGGEAEELVASAAPTRRRLQLAGEWGFFGDERLPGVARFSLDVPGEAAAFLPLEAPPEDLVIDGDQLYVLVPEEEVGVRVERVRLDGSERTVMARLPGRFPKWISAHEGELVLADDAGVTLLQEGAAPRTLSRFASPSAYIDADGVYFGILIDGFWQLYRVAP